MTATATAAPIDAALETGAGDVHPQRIGVRPRRVALALAAAAIAALPLLRPAGPGNSAPVADGLIALTIIATVYWAVVAHRPLRIPYGWAVAVLVVGGCIAALAHDRSWSAVLNLGQDLFLLAWCAALAALASTRTAVQFLLRTWAVAATGWAALVVVGVVTGNTALTGVVPRTGPRVSFTLGDPNFAANYFVVSLLIIVATRYPRGPLRLVSYVMILTVLVMTGSNGGVVTIAIALTAITVAALVRNMGPVPVVAALGLVLGLAGGLLAFTPLSQSLDAALNSQTQQNQNPLHQSLGRAGSSETSRGLLLKETTDLYRHGSLLGIGPGATKQALEARQAPYVKMAHDDYVAAVLERGLIGGLGLLLLIAAATMRTRLAVGALRLPALVGVAPRAEGLVAVVIVFAVAAAFYEVLHLRHLWAVLGILAGLALMADR